jgi:hypothetical protein
MRFLWAFRYNPSRTHGLFAADKQNFYRKVEKVK